MRSAPRAISRTGELRAETKVCPPRSESPAFFPRAQNTKPQPASKTKIQAPLLPASSFLCSWGPGRIGPTKAGITAPEQGAHNSQTVTTCELPRLPPFLHVQCQHVRLSALRTRPATCLAVCRFVSRAAAPVPQAETQQRSLQLGPPTHYWSTLDWDRNSYGTSGTGAAYDARYCPAGCEPPERLLTLACPAQRSRVLVAPPGCSPHRALLRTAHRPPTWLRSSASRAGVGRQVGLSPPRRCRSRWCRAAWGLPLFNAPLWWRLHLFRVRRVPEEACRSVHFPLAVHKECRPLLVRCYQASCLVPLVVGEEGQEPPHLSEDLLDPPVVRHVLVGLGGPPFPWL